MTEQEKKDWIKKQLRHKPEFPGDASLLDLGFTPWREDSGDDWRAWWFKQTAIIKSESGHTSHVVTFKLVLTEYGEPTAAAVMDGRLVDCGRRVWTCQPMNIDDMSWAEQNMKFGKGQGLDSQTVLGMSAGKDAATAVYKCVRKLLLAMSAYECLEDMKKSHEQELARVNKEYAAAVEEVNRKTAANMDKITQEQEAENVP